MQGFSRIYETALKRAPIMYPTEKSNYILSMELTENHQCDGLSSDSEITDDDDNDEFNQGHIYKERVHVAVRIRDLTENPGHYSSWQGIDQEHDSQIIPNSLYLFLRLLFCDGDSLNKVINEDNSIKLSVWRIAENIVYAVSNKRKITPKHLGLGLTLHKPYVQSHFWIFSMQRTIPMVLIQFEELIL